jgi:hypothetical protein
MIFDPAFLISMAFIAWFNFVFDRAFRVAVLLNPRLSFLYVFQFNIVIPAMDSVILFVAFLISKRLRGRRALRKT